MTEAEELELLELEELEAQEAAKQQDSSPFMDAGKAALGVGIKALDYAGGLGRTAAAGLANIPYSIATGKSLTKPEDSLNMLKGQAPGTAEYLERAKVPEGASVNLFPEVKVPFTDIKLGEGKTSVRDAAGFAGDIALDPLTYVSGGTSALLKKYPALKKLLRPASESSEAVGKKIYKSGLKNIDEKIGSQGADSLSDLMMSKNKFGTTKQIQEAAEKIEGGVNKKRNTLYQIANENGVLVDPATALASAEQRIARIRRNPNMNDLADKLQTQIDNFKNEGKVTVDRMSEWKTDLYNTLPDSAFDQYGKIKGQAQRVNKAMASGMKKEIESATNAAIPGLGNEISKTNSQWQTLITAKKPLQKQVNKAKNINAITSVDMGILGTAGFGNLPATAGLLLSKKVGDLSKTTAARTAFGLGLKKVAEKDIPDYLLRRGAQSYEAPWLNMDKDKPSGETN
jgi:hypothetical protein